MEEMSHVDVWELDSREREQYWQGPAGSSKSKEQSGHDRGWTEVRAGWGPQTVVRTWGRYVL